MGVFMSILLIKKGKKLSLIISLLILTFLGCSKQSADLASDPNLVQAQERNRTPDRQIPGTNPLELLKLEQVQQELGLTNAQIDQLRQANAEIASKLTNSGLPSKQLADQAREKVAQILSQDQLNRFKQIAFQIHGWAIMSKEEVTEILVITPEQEQKLQVFREQNKDKLNNSLQVVNNRNPQECQKVLVNNYQKLMAASQESNQKLASILTADQLKILTYIKGEKFELNLTKIPAICP
jgi:outer membrane receptor for Fe3+-dicitrate